MLLIALAVLDLIVLAPWALEATDVDGEPPPSFYFAYGSNLDTKQMKLRCPTADLHGLARMMGYKFVINERGVASVVESSEHAVEGLLWKIFPHDECLLDWYEGVAGGYYIKERLDVEDLTRGEMVEALVYIATDKDLGGARPGYLEKIIQAARQHGFTEKYLQELQSWK